jgi:deaminated glutathione amidase
MRAAAVQLNSTDEYDRNLEVAERLVRGAAADGAELVVLPEKWTVLGSPEAIRSCAEPLDGPALSAAAGWARELGIHLVAGSFPEVVPEWERLGNTSVMFGPDGERLAIYRKIHMFDVEVGGVSYRESEVEQAGDAIALGDVAGTPVGLTICYDLRFPELYRVLALEGALLATVPAHFTLFTGKDHWHMLLRARAVENGFYVSAPAQVGETGIGRPSYGRSLIVDPWGTVLAQAPDEETVISAELDRAWLEEVRRRLPSLSQRRPEAYRWPTPA